ncbi:MAG: hypothetical protein ACI8W3_002445 [Myxococcota bacterium]|jgi:hypothetical protein
MQRSRRLSLIVRIALLLVVAMLCTVTTLVPRALADDDSMDDILGGFDEPDELEASTSAAESGDAAAEANRIWSLQGDVSFGLTANLHEHKSPPPASTDYSGVQRFRTKLALQLDVDLPRDWKFRTSGYGYYDLAYLMNGRHDYTKDVRDTHEYDFQLSDTYLEGSLHDRVDLKVGRQVVNWGRSESLRVLDIVNPLDNREPGLVDIEDIRLSVGMVKLGVFHGPWRLTLLAIPEVRYDLFPGQGSDQAPNVEAPATPEAFGAFRESLSTSKQTIFDNLFAEMGADLVDIREHTQQDFGKSTEFAANITGVFSGWDVSLQAARYNDDRAHFDLKDRRLEHSRLWMVGAGANYTVGSWLFKAELAYLDGFEFLWATDKKNRIDAMVGVEYYGINDVNIVLEVAERHLFDFEDSMELLFDFAQEDSIETALRVTFNFYNDQFHFTALAFAIGEKAQDGSIVRLSGEYDVMDAFSVHAGFLVFQGGDSIAFAGSGDNDRFFAGAKYSF